MNYTPEQTAYITSEYTSNPEIETVDRLANELNKTRKSIIGKLSKEGVYRRRVYQTKLGTQPITKAEIVADICVALDFEDLTGLEKAPKHILLRLKEAIAGS